MTQMDNILDSSPHQSATSSITESPESFESSLLGSQTSLSLDGSNKSDNLEHCDEEKRSIIIDKLYQFIETEQPLLVAKITGMIIHKQSANKLHKLLSNHQLLRKKISQAQTILTKDDTEYGKLYSHISAHCASHKDKMQYLRSQLYPKVEAYVSQKNLADIITGMLMQLNISEIFVLLNESNTLEKRMNAAIKAYLEANAVHIDALNEYQNQN